MKKILIGVLLASCSMTANAQEDSTAANPWSIGTITNYDIIVHRYNRTPTVDSHYAYEGGFNFTSGIRAQYRFNDEIALRLGVAYSRKDFTEQYSCIDCDAVILPAPTTLKLRYIDMPFTARYLLRPGKLSLHAEGGVRGSFRVQAWKVYDYGELRPPQTFIANGEYRPFLMSGIFGLQANLRANDNFSIDLGPSIAKPFYSPRNSGDLNWWEFTIQAGLNYHF